MRDGNVGMTPHSQVLHSLIEEAKSSSCTLLPASSCAERSKPFLEVSPKSQHYSVNKAGASSSGESSLQRLWSSRCCNSFASKRATHLLGQAAVHHHGVATLAVAMPCPLDYKYACAKALTVSR